MNFVCVALGGALGAIGRYAISLIPARTQFPLLTLLTNLIGALLIGFVVGIAQSRIVSKNAVLFWKTGVCGGGVRGTLRDIYFVESIYKKSRISIN